MSAFLRYFIKYPVAANLIMVAILGLGVVGMVSMKSTFFPEVASRIITIQTIYPGASPEEVEEGIIARIEENLKGITGLERVTSVSSENSGIITVEVQRGYNTTRALDDVQNAVDRINSFPVGMEPPVVFKQENLEFAISFSLSGDVDLRTLKLYGREVEEDLRDIEGISKVSLSGFPDEEIEIAFRESDLRAYNLTFTQATQAVRNANIDVTGGTIKGENEELLIRAKNKSYYAKGLTDIVVKTNQDGSVIRLYQIADIRDKWSDNPDRTYLNGKPSVVITVESTIEEDLLSIVEKVKAYIGTFNQEHELVKAEVVRDRSTTLRQRIDLLTKNGLIGFLLVLILLGIFLNWRLAFWVALAIPISFGGMFITAYALGVTINVISLFGMIVVIGILVDDGIVVGENIFQQYEDGVPRNTAAVEGTLQVLPAVFAAIVTTIIAFSSFYFISGRLGDFFAQMATVVILSLVFSLVEAMVILPTHVAHSGALKEGKEKNKLVELFDRFMAWMRDDLYGPVLRFTIHNKFLTFAGFTSILLLTLSSIGGGIVRTTFFPVIERDDVEITLQMPAGTREHITEKWLSHIESAVWQANEELSKEYFNNEKKVIEQVQKNLGPTTYEGNLNIALLDGENRDPLRLRMITNRIREIAGPIPEAEVVSYGARSAFGKPISIALVGNDYTQLDAATEKLKAEMNQLVELSDVVDNNQEGLREIKVNLKDKAHFLGLKLQDIIGPIRQGFFGSEVQRLQRGRDEVRVWVRYGQSDRSDISQLNNMRVRLPDGREFPLSEIATLEMTRGVIAINHIDGKREVKVEADISSDDVSVSDMTANLKEEIVPRVLADFPSVKPLFEGQNREQEKSAASISFVMPIILFLMFFSIALTFRSISQTITVFLLIPYCFIGVAWGHWLLGAPISLFSALGVIALIGILVNDSLVFVSTYNQLLKSGDAQMEALYNAGMSRFRPIVLTSVTTLAGLAPIMLEKSLQAQFLIPMAIAVAFGLLATTTVILILLPVLLVFVNRVKVYASWAWNARKPSFESVEAATPAEGGYEYLWYLALGAIGLFLLIMAF